jgi:basic amino acid/polyamine antiporter, APA family
MSLFVKKPLSLLMADAEDTEKGLKRTLGAGNLIALGIGAIIGAGLFVRTAAAAAQHAGPSVTIGFIVAAVGCAFAGLCYAEFASMIPVAGSAYTYSYATMGEFLAWIIGWDLILEYGVGAATVGIAWSEYFNKFLGIFGLNIPYGLCHSPFEHINTVSGAAISQLPAELAKNAQNGVVAISDGDITKFSLQDIVQTSNGIINLPALFIVFLITLVLIRGTKGSALVNSIIVILKVAIVLIFIAIGWSFIRSANHTPFIPDPTTYTNSQGVTTSFGGILGILGAAGVVFFAFIGFDAVSTAAQEAKNPKKDMPIGILGSLAICTVLYILFSYVLTGVASTEDFRTHGKEASVSYAIEHMKGETVNGMWKSDYQWLSNLITVAILAGFSSVILVMLLGQSRVFYSMSRDGLLPKVFSDVHPKFRTPFKANWIILIICGVFAAFVPGDIVGEMTSIGTLFAFIIVCAGVWIMRVKHPDLPRAFRTPMVPVVATLGILVCAAMIFGLGWTNWVRLLGWLAIGMVIYFGYSAKNSKLRNPDK